MVLYGAPGRNILLEKAIFKGRLAVDAQMLRRIRKRLTAPGWVRINTASLKIIIITTVMITIIANAHKVTHRFEADVM